VSASTVEEDAMEDRDSKPASAGIDFAATGFSAALRNLQVFTEEIGRVSRTSFAQNSKLIDELSGARDVGDFVAIQTRFMTGMFETFNEQVRLMMSHMADLPLGMAFPAEVLSGAAADSVQRAKSAVEEATASTMPDAGLEPHTNGAAGPADAQTGSEAAQTAAQAGGDAAQTALEAGSEAAQTTVEAGSEAAHQAVEGAQQFAEPAPAAEEILPIPEEYTPAATTLYTSFVAGAELGEAELAAAQEASESAVESTEWAAKASREAWEELAKAAAELLKADPGAEAPAPASDAEGEPSQPSSTD
jgi:hypothetical protein